MFDTIITQLASYREANQHKRLCGYCKISCIQEVWAHQNKNAEFT